MILSFLPLIAKEDLLHIKGNYLAFSYDFNQLYGEKVQFNFLSYTVTAQYIKIDLSSRAFYASGNILLKEGQKEIYGDELVFLPNEGKGLLVNYNKTIAFTPFGDINMELLLENKKSVDSRSGLSGEVFPAKSSSNWCPIDKSKSRFMCFHIFSNPLGMYFPEYPSSLSHG